MIDATNTQWKIRLMGIDAPEKKQAFGTQSKANLSDLIFGKTVTVEYSKKDKYGRTICKILVDGMDANLQQVKADMAWHYKKYAKEQPVEDRATYAHAEEQASAARTLARSRTSVPLGMAAFKQAQGKNSQTLKIAVVTGLQASSHTSIAM